ncbi:hypothetical protein MVEN_01845300 [Mycena venus]|uniref:DUF4470 domain-containing protein n=1 Tax=Mycena venus TaxID=2733690 RepID=A0A8H7CM52_9AGAR|nr:hypothetical protein MVEN_01845300 [Mycena venus]
MDLYNSTGTQLLLDPIWFVSCTATSSGARDLYQSALFSIKFALLLSETTMAKNKNRKKAGPPSGKQSQLPEAESLKEAGNALFQAKKFDDAAEKYSEAAKLAPSVVAYPGNLSAALTETGRYLEAIEAIRRAEEIAAGDPSEHHRLLVRLADRLGKCLYRASKQNILKSQFLSENEKLISSLRSVESRDPKKTSWWNRYDRVYFDALPIRKSALNPNLEFFIIGHDAFHSLLQGILDGWGPPFAPERTCPGDSDVLVHKLPAASRRALSFLFGGVGDARHVFGTFADICAQSIDPNAAIHFTLVDIQPAALARDLIFFLILWNSPSSSTDYESRVLSAKTMFYLFCCVAMPPDSHALFLNTCRQLTEALSKTGPALPPFILIEPDLVPAVVACVAFWMNLPSAITTIKVLKHAEVDPRDFLDGVGNPQVRAECEVYSSLKVLLPPGPYTTQVDALEAAHDQVEFGTPNALRLGGDPTNYSLFERGHYPQYFDRLRSPNQLVISKLDTLFARLDDLGEMNFPGTDPRWPSFTKFMFTVFGPMSRALKSSHSQVKFEFIAGDVVHFLMLLKSGSSSLDWRNDSPTSFTRAWMSNVPDYAGGILDMALYAVPCLQPIDIASVGMNCMLNGPAWKNSFEDFVYTYTLLRPEQLPQYLGCQIRWCRNVASVLHPPFCLLPSKLPLKPSQLASRVEFDGWLHRVLMRILAPPIINDKPNYQILMPTTLRTFVQLLIRAVEIGYPSSWIADFLNSLLCDTLHSSWRPYPTAPMAADTISKQYPCTKLQLSPWMADIEVVVASAVPILPRGLPLSECLDMAETRVFQATLNNVSTRQSYQQNPGLALVFCTPGFRPERGAFTTHQVLLSPKATGNTVQILYSILACDIDLYTKIGTVSWRMTLARFEHMKRDGWVLYLWQADGPFVASGSSNASEWKVL